jgi:hypothetical protein
MKPQKNRATEEAGGEFEKPNKGQKNSEKKYQNMCNV